MAEFPSNPLSLATGLIRHPSVTGDVTAVLDYLQDVLEARGFRCQRLPFAEQGTDPVDNLYARIGDAAPNLCFAGHVDVVPVGQERLWSAPPFAAEIRDGKLYGRGAADMKGGIAAFVAAAFAYLDQAGDPPPGSISLLVTGDEEGPAVNGTAKMLEWAAEHGERFDHCIVGEPTNREALGDTIKIGRRGSLSGTVTVEGTQGHVAYPDRAQNPLPALARLVIALADKPLDEGSAHFQPSNLEVVGIDVGNRAWNVIPAAGKVRFNIRYNDLWTPRTLEAWLGERLASAGVAVPYRLDLEPVVSDVFLTEPGPLVDILVEASEQVTGKRPELSTGGGTSDARFIKDHCPVIEFGLVGQTMHQVDEHIAVSDLEALSDVYRRVIAGYFEHFAARS
jgi:succinyl-diaminopimelate desuccinylase